MYEYDASCSALMASILSSDNNVQMNVYQRSDEVALSKAQVLVLQGDSLL